MCVCVRAHGFPPTISNTYMAGIRSPASPPPKDTQPDEKGKAEMWQSSGLGSIHLDGEQGILFMMAAACCRVQPAFISSVKRKTHFTHWCPCVPSLHTLLPPTGLGREALPWGRGAHSCRPAHLEHRHAASCHCSRPLCSPPTNLDIALCLSSAMTPCQTGCRNSHAAVRAKREPQLF